MNRRDFGLWGIELSSGEFAQALAALGVLQLVIESARISSEVIGSDLSEALETEDGAVPWSLDEGQPALLAVREAPSARFLASAWRKAAKAWSSAPDRAPRLEIQNVRYRDLPWIIEQLGHDDVGAGSVYARMEDEPSSEVGWNWPLRIGFLPGTTTEDLRRELEAGLERPWVQQMAKIAELGAGEESCDLLLLPFDLPDALAALLASPLPLRADCVVVLGRALGPAVRSVTLLQAVGAAAHASGVALADVPAGCRQSWFVSIVRTLSHNLTLDIALLAASREVKGSPPLLLAERRLVEFRLAQRVQDLGEILRSDWMGPLLVSLSQDQANRLGLPGERRLREIGDQLRTAPAEIGYYREMDMASVAAEIFNTTRKVRAATTPEPPPDRFLQAQVFDLSAGTEEEPRLLRRAWRAGAQHGIRVRVGSPNEDWPLADPRFPFPYEELPDATEHRLTVVLTEPHLLNEPQTAEILLPRRGDSSACTFFLYIKEGTERVEARLIVLHRNRVLQTALLRGLVAPGLHPEAEGDGIDLVVEAVIRPGLVDLEIRRRFGAALVLNHDSRSVSRVTTIADDHVEITATPHLQTEIKWFNDELSQIARNRSSFTGGITAEATVAMLRSFARHGSMLYRYIVRDRLGSHPIAGRDRIQIVSTEPEAILPAEFIYERKAPLENAPLCPNAAESLRKGTCGEACPRGADEEKFVCPLGFWGMSRVLERHAHDPDLVLNRDFKLQAEPLEDRKTLMVLGDTLVAASYRVDASCSGAMDSVRNAIEKATRRPPRSAESWQEWAREIAGGAPTLLALLVHTDQVSSTDPMQKMEIGKDSWLSVANLNERYVRDRPEKPSPLVMLLGCETNAPEVPFLSLVSEFRASGASVVLSTGSAVHSVHAVPVARRLFEVLARLIGAGGIVTFGEVMRSARRELLADGYPMVLCLAAFGDADWRLIGKEV